ncbi:hypothetical protein RvY_06166 [Ramazzottius varieornatus]|uniref:Uncharacterized protein n=1 Tax=Ramazzottius varieornatus TaxID=947166 RepID=A0A1D1UXM0_RAMVA|nr:hypothetical protein RvY_06166 [Ramazzottius varieornatus]
MQNIVNWKAGFDLYCITFLPVFPKYIHRLHNISLTFCTVIRSTTCYKTRQRLSGFFALAQNVEWHSEKQRCVR